MFGEISRGDVKELNLVLKTDVDGSVEPLRQSLEQLTNEEVHVKVIHAAPGAVTESDVSLSLAARGIVLAFQVGTEPGARKLAHAEGIEIRAYDIIYELIEQVEAAVSGMLEPVDVDIVNAHAEVLQVFPIRKIGNIAGARCDDGSILPNLLVRVLPGRRRGGERQDPEFAPLPRGGARGRRGTGVRRRDGRLRGLPARGPVGVLPHRAAKSRRAGGVAWNRPGPHRKDGSGDPGRGEPGTKAAWLDGRNA